MTKKVTLYQLDVLSGEIKTLVLQRTNFLDTHNDLLLFADYGVANAYLVNHIDPQSGNERVNKSSTNIAERKDYE